MLGGKIAGLSLFSIGGVGLIPFFMSGEPSKNWSVRSDGVEAATINFAGGATTNGINRFLKGSWVLLNKNKNEEAGMFNGGVFDIALPIKVLSGSQGKPNTEVLKKEARILYCHSDQSKDTDLVVASSGVGKKVYCKDLSESWMIGHFEGKYYRAIFAVAKKGILKDSGTEIQEVDLKNLSEGREEKFNEELVKVLKLAAKPRLSFRTDVHYINLKDGFLLTENPKLDWCGEKMCFLWGNIVAKSGLENNNSINCDGNNSLKGCTIKIINPSSDDNWKSFSSFWNLGNPSPSTKSL